MNTPPSARPSLPPPGTPEQVELTDTVALLVLTFPEGQRSDIVRQIVWRYYQSLEKSFPQYGDELLQRSTINFIRALRQRFESLHFAADGHVGHA